MVVVFGLGISTAAHADIWGYVDDTGRSHIATEKLDDRYQLFFKGGTRGDPPDARDTAAAAAAKSREEFRNTPLFQRMTNQPNVRRFEALIQQYAKMYRLDPALVKAVIAVESAFQPDAVSAKGALGLMQLMPGTAKRFAVSDPYNPQQNIEGGIKYLKTLLDRFPTTGLVLAAYNAGEAAVDPKNPRTTCRNCDLQPLCRIHERLGALVPDQDGDDES